MALEALVALVAVAPKADAVAGFGLLFFFSAAVVMVSSS